MDLAMAFTFTGNERYTIDNVVINTVNMLATSGDFTLGHEGEASLTATVFMVVWSTMFT